VEGQYDFSKIKQNLKLIQVHHSQLVVQIRDRSFSANPIVPMPSCLITDAYAKGYYVSEQYGFVAR